MGIRVRGIMHMRSDTYLHRSWHNNHPFTLPEISVAPPAIWLEPIDPMLTKLAGEHRPCGHCQTHSQVLVLFDHSVLVRYSLPLAKVGACGTFIRCDATYVPGYPSFCHLARPAGETGSRSHSFQMMHVLALV